MKRDRTPSRRTARRISTIRCLKVALPAVVVAAAVAGAAAIVDSAPEREPRPPEDRTPVVRLVEARTEDVRLDVSVHGTVCPASVVDVAPQVAGRVVHVSPSLREGEFVSEDQVLVRIDRRDHELAVTRTEAAVARARALLARERAEAEIARRDWERLGRTEPASPLVLHEPQLLEAEALLASAEADRDRARLDLSRTEVRAPFDGRVRSEAVDVGQHVAVGVTIATIIGTASAEVRLAVPEDRLRFVELPLTYSVEALPDGGGRGQPATRITLRAVLGGVERAWPARIVRTEAEVDPRSRVIRCIARVDDPLGRCHPGRAPLLPGMFVRAVLPGRRVEGAIALPRGAVRDASRVLVADEGLRLHPRAVKVLRRSEDAVWIESGLEAGERVCVTPVEPWVDGMRVREMEETP